MGFAICCRLLDEFLETRPPSRSITLIFTTRDKAKSDATATRLYRHLRRHRQDDEIASRVSLQPETLDLTELASVKALSQRLLRSTPKLDAIILNAGIGGFRGINWPVAVWTVLTDLVHSVTWPLFKLSSVGSLTKPQLPAIGASAEVSEPPLGEVFCSNVFGHYMLAHDLMPIMSCEQPYGTAGRIIWISSIEPSDSVFSAADIQGLRSDRVYESSKRLTDVLALTSGLPSTAPWTDRFFSSPAKASTAPTMHVTHPGICATAIVPLPFIVFYLMTAVFYTARWLGSPWHTVAPYSGACSAVWVALSPATQLEQLDPPEARSKWGSATGLWGTDRATRTEVDGWGYRGVVGEPVAKRSGRRRGAMDLTDDARADFEMLGRNVWSQMEDLRNDWHRRLTWETQGLSANNGMKDG